MARDKHYELDITFRKRVRNSNLVVISILFVYSLDIKFDGINLFGQATLKIGSPDNIHIWLWIFFAFFAFRFIQSYFNFKKENNILFIGKTNLESLTKMFYPKRFKEAFIDGELTKGNFRYQKIRKGVSTYFKTPYFIQGPIQTPSRKNTVYEIPVNRSKYFLVRTIVFIPSIFLYLLKDSDFLTAHLPFLSYLVLVIFMILN